jgi:hypothetical protein
MASTARGGNSNGAAKSSSSSSGPLLPFSRNPNATELAASIVRLRREEDLKKQFQKRAELHRKAVEQVRKLELLLERASFAPEDYVNALKDDDIDPYEEEDTTKPAGPLDAELTPAEINKRAIDKKRVTIRLLWRREFDARNRGHGAAKKTALPDGTFHPLFGDASEDPDHSGGSENESGSRANRGQKPSSSLSGSVAAQEDGSAPHTGRRLTILSQGEITDTLEARDDDHGFVDVTQGFDEEEDSRRKNDPIVMAQYYSTLEVDSPPQFCSNALPPILETVCRDAEQVISATDNILRFLEAQNKKPGQLNGELERTSFHARRSELWMREAGSHIEEYVSGQEWIRRGTVLETSAQRREYVNVLEEVEMLESACDKKAAENASVRKRIDGLHRAMERARFSLKPKKHLQADDLGWRESLTRIRSVLMSCRLELSGVEASPAQLERIGKSKVLKTQEAITHLLEALVPKDFDTIKQNMCHQ